MFFERTIQEKQWNSFTSDFNPVCITLLPFDETIISDCHVTKGSIVSRAFFPLPYVFNNDYFNVTKGNLVSRAFLLFGYAFISGFNVTKRKLVSRAFFPLMMLLIDDFNVMMVDLVSSGSLTFDDVIYPRF